MERLTPPYPTSIACCRGATGGAELLLDIFRVVSSLSFDFDLDWRSCIDRVELLRFPLGHGYCRYAGACLSLSARRCSTLSAGSEARLLATLAACVMLGEISYCCHDDDFPSEVTVVEDHLGVGENRSTRNSRFERACQLFAGPS